MADKAEFLQAVDDAILDADSLERFINGDDTQDVLTRLNAKYPTLQKALKELFENGGIAERFKTLSELQTEGADLEDGSYALVADDTDDKNGIYIKEGGAWVKSKYDPLTQAKSYTDASKVSPVFTGTPTAPTPPTSSNDGTLSTTKYVKDFVDEKFNKVANVSIGSAVGDVVLSNAQLNSGILNIYGNPTEPVNLVFPDDTNKTYLVRMSVSPSTVVNVKFSTRTSVKRIVSGTYHLTVNSLGFVFPYDKKADIDSPALLGAPTAPTPSNSSRDTSIATTAFVGRVAQAVIVENITDDSTEITRTWGHTIYLTGSLTKDVVLTIKASNISDNIGINIVNMTDGGKTVSIKGLGQSYNFIKLNNGEGRSIYTLATVAYSLNNQSSSLPVEPASKTSLGVVKIGSGINVDNSGTISVAGSGGSGTNLSYSGKFKVGGDYQAGDVVEHGSGIYQVVSSVTNAQKPYDDVNFQKIAHNYQAGDNKNVTVISNTREIIDTEFKKPSYLSRSGLVCFNNGTANLKISRDWGVTWSGLPVFSPPSNSWLRWTRELENGELMICVSQTDADNPTKTKIYKSRDWDEVAGTATSWDVVHEFQRKDVFIAGWGFSQYGNIILLAEYGGKNYVASGGVQDDYPRYCYLSKDSGETWSTIFDLADYTDGVGVHLHGVCFDEYWNRIWISHGDGSTGKNGLYYSDDLGKTWVSALQTQNQGVNFPQSVGIVALPTCILFSSDSYPNGVQRIDRAQGRIPHKGYYEVESAYMIEPQQELLNHILSTPYKAHWLPNTPYIWTWAAESRAGNTGCVLSWNGWDFHTVWKSDTDFDASRGAKTVIGITPENSLIVVGDETVDATKVNWKRTIKVSFD